MLLTCGGPAAGGTLNPRADPALAARLVVELAAARQATAGEAAFRAAQEQQASATQTSLQQQVRHLQRLPSSGRAPTAISRGHGCVFPNSCLPLWT